MTTPLEEIIKAEIRESGPISVARYMALCLGHPQYGYYMTRDPFGVEGDFTTAPEISQLFGEMIGIWLADTWIKMGSPGKVALVECGPGRGTLMQDALRATKNVAGFHEAVTLHLIEMSPVLQEQQKQRLAEYDASWHNDTESLPGDSPLLIIGNEFLDALPVRQMVFRETGWVEKFVEIDINGSFRLCEKTAENDRKNLLPTLLVPPKLGDHLEVSPEQKEFMQRIIKIIKKQRGSALFLDYGFKHLVSGDTLQSVKNHAFCNMLEHPGEVDITAHVNFAMITAYIMEENMTVHGPVSQGDFLSRLGIEVRADQLTRIANRSQSEEIKQALKRLTGQDTKAGEMGALFKAIAFSHDPSINLAGFS